MKVKKEPKEKGTTLSKMNNLIDYNQKIEKQDKTYEKLMFIYEVAIKELEIKIGILKDEFKLFYNYELIDHLKTRIKKPESIIQKMQKKKCNLTYKEMIQNINDIAGIRIICPLKKNIFTIKQLIRKIPEIHVLKEKDYVTNPKKSGYASYHQIVEVPVTLSQNTIYVKVEIQIRTTAMDYWASLEHTMKYKAKVPVSKKVSKELVSCAKIIQNLDNKMLRLEVGG